MTPTIRRIFHLLLSVIFTLVNLAYPALASQASAGFEPEDQAAGAANATGGPVLVDHAYPQAVKLIEQAGGQKLVDYGGFSLWQIPAGKTVKAVGLARAGLQALPPTLRLRNYTLSTQTGQAVEPELPSALRQTASEEEQFWLVQFIGPIKSDWLETLKSSGLQIVAYIPDNAYVVWGRQPQRILAGLPGSLRSLVQWTGAYHPAYRIAPVLLKTVKPDALNAPAPMTEPAGVTVQFYTTPALKASLERLLSLALEVYRSPYAVERFTAVSVKLPPEKLAEVAGYSDVFNIESWNPPVKLDEAQGQILAGNVTTSDGKVLPSSPGYMTFLASHNFSTNPDVYPLVDVVDDGLDIGNAANVLHPDFHFFGRITNPDRVSYINNCTSDPSANSMDGHGNINASIMAGYNYLSGFPYSDPAGYQRGLGISPFGRMAATKIFANGGAFDLSKCASSYTHFVQAAYSQGARITSNSWGDNSGFGQYSVDSYEYDVLTRDASPAVGNQEMLHIFAAGNSGQTGMRTINTPATAKNVLTVGATEGVRDNGIQDGCGLSNSDNADDIASFSSRGPTADGRIKPDIMAPGTHIQGAASQDPKYNGSGVCGGGSSPYYPAGQTLYTWSSGTSHSTPAVAGVAQLTYEYFQRVLKPGIIPSPAMLKALIVNTPRYLGTQDISGSLPSAQQGWGDPNMGLMFDNAARIIKDQTHLFSATGQEYSLYGMIPDSSRPLHVSLVWTDAPGATTGAAYVNDLNLEVIAGGQIYKGNVFNGANSNPGGSFDGKNNVENVFVPTGASGSFRVRVTAANIAGDGLPGNASLLDQDFALVIYNATETADAPVLLLNSAVRFDDSAGNNNGAIDPGESIAVQVELQNIGTQSAAGITTSVSVLSGIASIGSVSQAVYPDLLPSGAALPNSPPSYDLAVNLRQPCGGEIWLLQRVTYNSTSQANLVVGPLVTGALTTSSYTAGGLPLNIPDRNYQGLKVTIDVPEGSVVRDIDVRLDITHTFDSDLGIAIISPYGLEKELSAANGGSMDNFTGTIFDEQAVDSIFNGKPPFTGRFKPEESFYPYSGKSAGGTWQLWTIDYLLFDVGTLNSYSIDLQTATCSYIGLKHYVPMLFYNP